MDDTPKWRIWRDPHDKVSHAFALVSRWALRAINRASAIYRSTFGDRGVRSLLCTVTFHHLYDAFRIEYRGRYSFPMRAHVPSSSQRSTETALPICGGSSEMRRTKSIALQEPRKRCRCFHCHFQWRYPVQYDVTVFTRYSSPDEDRVHGTSH